MLVNFTMEHLESVVWIFQIRTALVEPFYSGLFFRIICLILAKLRRAHAEVAFHPKIERKAARKTRQLHGNTVFPPLPAYSGPAVVNYLVIPLVCISFT